MAQAFMGSKLTSCSVLYALSIRSRRARLEPSAALSTQCDSTKVKPCSLLSSRSDTSASPLCAALLCLKLRLPAAPGGADAPPLSSPSASALLLCCLGVPGTALPYPRLAAAPEEKALQCSAPLLPCCLGLMAGLLLTCVTPPPCTAGSALPGKPGELCSCCLPAASATCTVEACAVHPSSPGGPCTAVSSCSGGAPPPAACACTAAASLLQLARSMAMLRMERLLAWRLLRPTAAGLLSPRLLGRFPLDALS